MKTTYSYLAVVATTLAAFGVQAQEQCSSLVAQIPSCAATCIQSAASAAGCQSSDLACQCASDTSSKINSAAIGCVLSGCGEQTGLMVAAAATKVCDCASSAGGTPATAAAANSTANTAAVATARTTGTGVVAPVPLGPGPVQVTTGSLARTTGSATMSGMSAASAASAASTGATAVTLSGSASKTSAASGSSISGGSSSGGSSGSSSSSSSSGASSGIVSQMHSIGLVAAMMALASFMMTAVGGL